MFGTQLPFQAGEIVADVKHAAIFGTDILGTVNGEMLSATSAFKVSNSHRGKDSILALSSQHQLWAGRWNPSCASIEDCQTRSCDIHRRMAATAATAARVKRATVKNRAS